MPVVEEIKEVDTNDTYGVEPSNLNIESIKKSIFRKLRGTSITLASTLEKAEKWEKRDKTIYLTYTNPFEAALVQKEKSKVLSLIRELDSGINSIIIQKSNENNIDDNNQVKDEQIEKILTMFRGSIV